MYYLHRDYLGSIRLISDDTGDAADDEYSYDPWGRLRNPATGENYSRLQQPVLMFNRGYTGHEHLPWFGLINMNARLYDPILGRFLSPDPFVQAPDWSQNFNRYSYAANNPLLYIDENGEWIWIPVIIGAVVGAYTGGVIANNGNYNPFQWDYNGKTWGYMLGGAVIGGVSGYAGAAIAAGGGFMANTAGIAFGSYLNSMGMAALSGGAIAPSISFGVASFNFGTGKFGHLFKKGNKWHENLGYGLGALANLRDIANLPFFNREGIEQTSKITKLSDAHSHSAWQGNDGSLISYGPRKLDNLGDYAKALVLTRSTTKYLRYLQDGPDALLTQSLSLNKFAVSAVNFIGKGLPYNVFTTNCTNMQMIAYWLSGVPAIGLHPYILYATTYLYNNGFRPDLFSYYLLY